jgi:hypothetical protein
VVQQEVPMMLNDLRLGEGVANMIAAALGGEPIIASNSLAALTTSFLVIRNSDDRSLTILSLLRVSGLKILKAGHLIPLAMSGGLSVVSAAALCSREGDGASVPAALLAFLLLLRYWTSRRAAIRFYVKSEAVQSVYGAVAEAASMITAIQRAQATVGIGDTAMAAGCVAPSR